MQLKLTTDYAIRTIVYLATQSGITSVAEIGSKMGISENYLMKVLKGIERCGAGSWISGKKRRVCHFQKNRKKFLCGIL